MYFFSFHTTQIVVTNAGNFRGSRLFVSFEIAITTDYEIVSLLRKTEGLLSTGPYLYNRPRD